MQIDVAWIWSIELFFNKIIDIIMRDFFVFTMIMKTRYHDIGIPIPKSHDIEIPKPKNCDFKIRGLRDSGTPRHREMQTNKPGNHDSKAFFQRTKSHNIEIPRLKNHDIEIPGPKSHDIKFLQVSDPYIP